MNEGRKEGMKERKGREGGRKERRSRRREGRKKRQREVSIGVTHSIKKLRIV